MAIQYDLNPEQRKGVERVLEGMDVEAQTEDKSVNQEGVVEDCQIELQELDEDNLLVSFDENGEKFIFEPLNISIEDFK